jgi:hypothetical protein
VAADRICIAHQFGFCAIADAKACQFRLLEIAAHPKTVYIDNVNVAGSFVRVVALPHQKIGYVTIHRTTKLRPPEVDLCLSDLLFSGIDGGLRLYGAAPNPIAR